MSEHRVELRLLEEALPRVRDLQGRDVGDLGEHPRLHREREHPLEGSEFTSDRPGRGFGFEALGDVFLDPGGRDRQRSGRAERLAQVDERVLEALTRLAPIGRVVVLDELGPGVLELLEAEPVSVVTT